MLFHVAFICDYTHIPHIYKNNLLEDIFSVLKSKEWNGVSHHPENKIKNH